MGLNKLLMWGHAWEYVIIVLMADAQNEVYNRACPFKCIA